MRLPVVLMRTSATAILAATERFLPQAPGYSRLRAIIDSYTLAFFDTYLRGASNPLMCVRHSPYSEVHFLLPTEAQLGGAG